MGSVAFTHPLDPATAEEIQAATDLVKQLFKDVPLHFKAAGLDETPKKELSAYLEAEHNGQMLPDVPRRVFVMWYIKHTPRLFEAVVDVTNGRIETSKELPRDFHGPVDRTELNEAAQVVMRDPEVLKEIKRLKIDETTVVLDPWDYGVDGEETQERHTQVCRIIPTSRYFSLIFAAGLHVHAQSRKQRPGLVSLFVSPRLYGHCGSMCYEGQEDPTTPIRF